MSTLEIIISAQDRASAAIQGVEKTIEGLGTKVKRVGGELITGLLGSRVEIDRAARIFDKNMHTALAPVLDGLFLAGDFAQPFGDAIAGGLHKVAELGPVKAAAAALGGAIGTVQAEAQALAATGEEAIAKLGARLALMEVPLAAEGTTLGMVTGKAISAGMVAGVAVGGGAVISAIAILPQQWALDQTYASVGAALADKFTTGYTAEIRAKYATMAQAAFNAARASGATLEAAGQAGKDAGDAVLAGLNRSLGGTNGLDAQMEYFALSGATSLADQKIWDASAQSIMGDLATSLQKNTNVIDTAMAKVQWAIAHPLEIIEQEANLAGAITDLEFKRGIAGNSDELNTVLDQQLAILQGQWATISGHAWDAGQNTAASWNRGFRSVDLGFRGPTILGGREVISGQRAAGGPVGSNQTYLVGEKGPELLHMGNNSGNITPNNQMGGHGHDIYLDKQKVGQALDRWSGQRMALASSAAYTRG